VRRRVGFDPQGRLRRVEVLASDGALEWSAGFGSYEPVGGVPFAHEITLFVTEGRTRVRITLHDVELNPQLPDGIFNIHPAPGLGER
jgi:hypothetical protein